MTKNTVWPLKTLVEVEWLDACTGTGWNPESVYREECGLSRCRSVGYIFETDKEKLVLIQSMSSDTQHLSASLAIPKVGIVRMKKLKGLS